MGWKNYSGLTKVILIMLSVLVVMFLIFWSYTKITSQTLGCNTIAVGIMKSLNPGGSTPLTRDDVDFCLYHESLDKKSEKTCSLISGENRRDDCYWEVGKEILSKDTCARVQLDWKMNSCYSSVAEKLGDFEVCNLITGSDVPEEEYQQRVIHDGIIKTYKEECFNSVALATKDAAICRKIGNQEYKEICFWNVARATGQTNICDSIANNITKSNCIADAK